MFSNDDIREIIISKTKSIRNIFANNNYKPLNLEKRFDALSSLII